MANKPTSGLKDLTQERREYAARCLILLMAAASAVCAVMSTVSFSPIIGVVAQEQRVDLGSASFAFIGAPTFAMALGMAIFGFVIDRLGVICIVVGSLVALIVSNAVVPVFGHDYVAMLIIRLVQGLCSAGLMVSITPAIARWFPQDKIGRAMALPSIGAGIGMIVGLNAAPLFIQNFGSWQLGSVMLAAVAAVALTIAAFAARLTGRLDSSVLVRPGEKPTRAVNFARFPIFWSGLAVAALACWANMSFSDLTPGFLSVKPPVGVGYGPQQAGGLMSLVALSSVAGAPLAGFLMDKVFRRQNRVVILLGFLLSAAAYTAILSPAIHNQKGVLAATLLLGGLAIPFVNVTLMSIAAKTLAVDLVGRVCGLWMSISFFAGAFGVVVGSFALKTSGNYWLSLAIVGTASVMGFFVAMLLPRNGADRDGPIASTTAGAQEIHGRSLSSGANFKEML
ncbi:MFS transporter [Paraburkholderia caffeinilytica]|uniref:MFS transporter n=1 Tax=Paraburkholderia caffeinilytica TaxID=1761016 RepID=UPI003DA1BF49